MCEAAGIPIGLAIDGANRNDCKLTEPTIESIPIERSRPTDEHPQGVCLDKAYDHDFVRDLLKDLDFTPTSAAVVRRPYSYAQTSVTAPVAGSWSVSTHGSTATAPC